MKGIDWVSNHLPQPLMQAMHLGCINLYNTLIVFQMKNSWVVKLFTLRRTGDMF